MRLKKHLQKAAKSRLSPQKRHLLTLSSLYLKGKFNPSLLVAIAVVAWSAVSIIRPHLTPLDIPYGDGWGFASRGIQMHGLLHSGHWSRFWDMLISPMTFTVLPTYLVFWLMPAAWASCAAYGVIHVVIWHLLLLLGLWGILKELRSLPLLLATLLLTLANNNVLDITLYYYMDMSFAASALVAIWLLVRGWNLQTRGAILASGIGAGLLLFVKPANAFMFMGWYVMACVMHFGTRWLMLSKSERGEWSLQMLRSVAVWGCAFLPFFILACGWTLVPNVIARFVGLSTDYWSSETSKNVLLRALYFPLCLSYYYSFAALSVSALLVGFMRLVSPSLENGGLNSQDSMARCSLIALSVSFVLAWGLTFSFVLPAKIIRSLTPMIPLLWVCLFGWLSMRWRLTRTVTCLAALYFMVVHAQFAFGVAGMKQNRGTESYTLNGDWINRLPSQKTALEEPVKITQSILSLLRQCGVQNGKVGVGTEMLYWNSTSLNWIAQEADLKQGNDPELRFVTLVDHQGNPILSSVLETRAFILMVHPAIQYSREVFDFNLRTAQYAVQKWDGLIASSVKSYSFGDGQPAIVIVVFKKPLDAHVCESYLKEVCPGRRSVQSERDESLFQSRLSFGEYWRMLRSSKL